MPKPPQNPGERELIESLRARVKAGVERPARRKGERSRGREISGLRLGIGDDCAILDPPRDHEILVTTDFSLENVHFRRDWQPPESVGHRCLARGLSDLAAMGARPLAALLSLALSPELVRSRNEQPSWRDRFFAGFLALADKYSVPLGGGDTAQSPRFSETSHGSSTGLALADIVLIGSAPRGRALLRSRAKAGDRIYVTGQLGGAGAELAQIATSPRHFRGFTASAKSNDAPEINPHPHLFPEPRLAVGAWLLKNNRATAAIDISDGLSTDLDHLCEESGVAAMLEARLIPIHPLAQSDPFTFALDGGEDYELLFTAAPEVRIPRCIAGVPIACIGKMRRRARNAPRMVLRKGNAEWPLHPAGWEHYQ
ncbi:MAG: thiamine-phosphate kinase [Acidobacteriaceae bacterium]